MVAISLEAIGQLVSQGRFREALAGCRRLLATRPRDAGLLHLQAHCLHNLGRTVDALVAAQAALRLAPQVPAIRLQEAEILSALGRHAQAAQAYETLLDLPGEGPDQSHDGPIHDSALAGLAETRAATGDHDAALGAARRLERRHPENPGVLNAVASCLILAGWAGQAVEVLERALTRSADAPPEQRAPILHNLAKAAADKGDLAAALGHARAAAKAAPPGRALPAFGSCRLRGGGTARGLGPFRAGAQPPAAPGAGHGVPRGRAADSRRHGRRPGTALPRHGPCGATSPPSRRRATTPPKPACRRPGASRQRFWRDALAAAPEAGLVLEFGVYTGRSIAWLAEGGAQVHGFDSFEGLPGDWTREVKAGGYSTAGRRPDVAANVTLHVGWFEETLPAFLAREAGPLRLANIDCDLYSSTRCVLEALAPRLVVGSVLVFDEYFTYPGWRDHEWKAFQGTGGRARP